MALFLEFLSPHPPHKRPDRDPRYLEGKVKLVGLFQILCKVNFIGGGGEENCSLVLKSLNYKTEL